MAEKDQKIQVIVRKRPLNSKEISKGDHDILLKASQDTLVVREQKLKLDLSKYIEEHSFTFDGVYSEETTNQELYISAVQPIVQASFQGAKVTCFAYGQTGSGKTFTMMGEGSNPGLYLLAANDLFFYRDQYFRQIKFAVSFYEIYCGKLHDLLNERNQLFAREDAKQTVNIVGLQNKPVETVENLMKLIGTGMEARTTGQTGANDDSSRSHAVLEINLKQGKKLVGKMSFIDLAGSERGADVSGADFKTRMDGAEINKSLLALKECIRALDQEKRHTPFRGSKLTQVLKDSFVGNCRTVMIANVSPGMLSCEHTLNTLRYADRVKELRRSDKAEKKEEKLANVLMLPRQANNVIRYNVEESEESMPPPKPMKPEEDASRLLFKKAGKEDNKFKSKIGSGLSGGKPAAQNPYIVPKPVEKHKPASMNMEELSERHEQLIGIILAEEEDLINSHRKMIDEMVDMIKHQMSLISEVDKPGSDVDNYVRELDAVLGIKEDMIRGIREKLKVFNEHLKQEEELTLVFERNKAFIDVFNLDNHDDDLLQDIDD
jgi:kinesin family member 2/24